jgi:transposase
MGLGSKLHVVCDGLWRPEGLLLTAGNVNDIVDAEELLKNLLETSYPLADEGYAANRFREKLEKLGR